MTELEKCSIFIVNESGDIASIKKVFNDVISLSSGDFNGIGSPRSDYEIKFKFSPYLKDGKLNKTYHLFNTFKGKNKTDKISLRIKEILSDVMSNGN